MIPDDSILYMKQSEDSSSRYFILHKKVDKGTEYVYATECDDCDGKLRPVKEPVSLGSIVCCQAITFNRRLAQSKLFFRPPSFRKCRISTIGSQYRT